MALGLADPVAAPTAPFVAVASVVRVTPSLTKVDVNTRALPVGAVVPVDEGETETTASFFC